MVYELRPESIKTFINDRTIRLPRFQRKLSWDPSKNFRLCLSLFRDYPLGVIVIRVDQLPEGRPQRISKTLLDGRQRRHALMTMMNPESIYDWARDALGLNGRMDRHEVTTEFWQYVDEYFGEEEPPGAEVIQPEVMPLGADDEEGPTSEANDAVTPAHEATPAGSEEEHSGLSELLELLLAVHPKRKTGSGFTKAFDFRTELDGLVYVQPDSADRDIVSAERLMAWIESKKKFAEIEGKDFPPTLDDFIGWLTTGTTLKVQEARLEDSVERKWPAIQRMLSMLDSLDKRMQEAKIGYLEIRECTTNDEKKIFEIINTAGTRLTAAEILSARPSWNKIVETPDLEIVRAKNSLYESIGVTASETVRWDVAATLLDRIEVPSILGKW